MKKTIVTLLLVMTSGILSAQLANSKWKGTLRGDNPQDVIFDFRKDTAVVYAVEDNSHVETMTYTVKDMILSLMKIEGISDCDNSSPGKYRIALAGDILYLKKVDDNCSDRYEAIDSIKWVKWTDRPAAKGSTGFLKQETKRYELNSPAKVSITSNHNDPCGPASANGLTKSFFYGKAQVDNDVQQYCRELPDSSEPIYERAHLYDTAHVYDGLYPELRLIVSAENGVTIKRENSE